MTPPVAASGWRGRLGKVREAKAPGGQGSILGRVGRELAEHPAETAALVTMAVTLWRLLRRRHDGETPLAATGFRRRRAVLPLGMMAVLCILGLSA
ncbi:MAG TPA: hypothetical protein VFV70_00030 [Hyphomonadaceae bacterium]|nr:hypothetical protein [Hyphomonadaceae bacterium]